MKKTILKALATALMAFLIALNVTSTMDPSFGGEEVQARDVDPIPCWSAYNTDPSGVSRFVYCLTCKEKKGVERNTAGTCTPGGGGGSDPEIEE